MVVAQVLDILIKIQHRHLSRPHQYSPQNAHVKRRAPFHTCLLVYCRALFVEESLRHAFQLPAIFFHISSAFCCSYGTQMPTLIKFINTNIQ